MMKEILYKSTRSAEGTLKASEAILKGLADDGGLFVPLEIPALDVTVEELSKMTYQQVAYEVMKLYFTDFTEEELKNCINNAYDSKFDTEEIAPLAEVEGTYFLELFHGKTIAFKDMALSILPHLLTTSAKKNGVKNEIVILTATSGDTGKAAMAGFADVPGTRIIVFYPNGGVSPIQEKQMVTQKGDNTYVVAIEGNFDQAQSAVKAIFGDKELAKEMDEKGFQFSSANSINIGRLIPQVAYYVYAYAKLFAEGKVSKDQKINVVVPTGNFGNILAAYYAKNMGLPIDKLICASNENRVLYDFFTTGEYDKNREFILTNSPSMDILISSNLERLIYRIAGDDAEANKKMMEELKPQAEKRIRTRLVLEAIVAAENIEVSDERLDEELQKMADSYQMEVEKLKDENVASMAVLSEENRRMQEMMKMYGMGGMDASMFGSQATLVLNANHPLVQFLVTNKDSENVSIICKQLYDLAMLAHKPLSPEEMTAFVKRSNDIMMLLTK